MEPEEFQKRLENGSYTIALAPVQAEGRQCLHRTGPVLPTGGGLTGYSDALYTTQLSASATATGSTRCSLLAACERQLLEQAVAVPLFTQQKRLLVANGIEGLVFDPFGPVLDVTYATKVDRRLSLSLWEQRRRPPPAAETGRSCWGSGQQDASGSEANAGSRNPGSVTEGDGEGKDADDQI